MSAKINYDKDIDKNIRELVKWINEETKFKTLSSCSSHPEKGEFKGYITFKYSDETASFLNKVLDKLADKFKQIVTLKNGYDVLYYAVNLTIWYGGYYGKLISLDVDFTNVCNYQKEIEDHPVDDFEKIVVDFWKEVYRIMKDVYVDIESTSDEIEHNISKEKINKVLEMCECEQCRSIDSVKRAMESW